MTEAEQNFIAEQVAQKIAEMRKRPTLQELQAIAGEWGCPRCGCEDSRVVDSRFDGESRKRIRACRHCNQRISTIEVVAE